MPQPGSTDWPGAESPALNAPTKGTSTPLGGAGDANRDHDQWHADVSALLIAIQSALVAHELGGTTYHKVTVDVSVNGHKVTNLATPTAGTDAATKAYVDATAAGLSPKPSVKGASTTNHSVAAFSGSTIDGGSVSLTAGDRILLKDQSTAPQNGIWVFNGAGSALTRPTDFATGSQEAGAYVFVESGTTNGGSGWVLASTAVTVDTTAQTWTQFTGLGEVTAGSGLTKTGNTLNVVANADGTIVANADDVQIGTLIAANVPSGLITSAMVADGTIINADVSASAAIARSKLDFGSGLVNADIAAAAAIAYSKLALSGSIVNGDVNAAAAIAYSKLNLSASIVHGDVAAANKDGTASTPSMRTLGTGTTQAAPGNDPLQLGIASNFTPGMATTQAAQGTANDARYMRLLSGGYLVTNVGVQVAGTAAGNVCVAFYTNSGSGRSAQPTGGRLGTTGDVACPSAGFAAIALVATCTPKINDWAALGGTSTTPTFTCNNGGSTVALVQGFDYVQAGAYNADGAGTGLPATPASLTASANRHFSVIGY